MKLFVLRISRLLPQDHNAKEKVVVTDSNYERSSYFYPIYIARDKTIICVVVHVRIIIITVVEILQVVFFAPHPSEGM